MYWQVILFVFEHVRTMFVMFAHSQKMDFIHLSFCFIIIYMLVGCSHLGGWKFKFDNLNHS